MNHDISESPVYSVTPLGNDKFLHALTVKMQQLATNVKSGYANDNVIRVVDNSQELADTVIEFLRVSGWSR